MTHMDINLPYEHGAQATFVCAIILLKAFTLTNCLRSKEEKKTEIQLNEMWENWKKKVFCEFALTESMRFF